MNFRIGNGRSETLKQVGKVAAPSDIQRYLCPWLEELESLLNPMSEILRRYEEQQTQRWLDHANSFSVANILRNVIYCRPLRRPGVRTRTLVIDRVYHALADTRHEPPTPNEVWNQLTCLADDPSSGVADYDYDKPQPKVYFFTADGFQFDQGVCFKTVENIVSRLNAQFF